MMLEQWISGNEEARDLVKTTYNALFDDKLISLSADMIAYTEDFEILYCRVHRCLPLTRNEVFVLLINLRKARELRTQKSNLSTAKMF